MHDAGARRTHTVAMIATALAALRSRCFEILSIGMIHGIALIPTPLEAVSPGTSEPVIATTSPIDTPWYRDPRKWEDFLTEIGDGFGETATFFDDLASALERADRLLATAPSDPDYENRILIGRFLEKVGDKIPWLRDKKINRELNAAHLLSKTFRSLSRATIDDLDAIRERHFDFRTSRTLQEFGKSGLDWLPVVIRESFGKEAYQSFGSTRLGFVVGNISDVASLVDGMSKLVGRRGDPELWEQTTLAAVGLTSGALAFKLSGGDPKVAGAASAVAKKAAKAGAWLSLPLFQRGYAEVFDLDKAFASSFMQNNDALVAAGLEPVRFEEFLGNDERHIRATGLTELEIQRLNWKYGLYEPTVRVRSHRHRQYRERCQLGICVRGNAGSLRNRLDQQLARDYEYPAARVAEIPVRSLWTSAASSNSDKQLLAEARMMTDMARGAERVLVVGDHPAAAKMYEESSRRLGQDHVFWKRNYLPDPARLEAIARAHGATTVLGVKPVPHRAVTQPWNRAPDLKPKPSLPDPCEIAGSSCDRKYPPVPHDLPPPWQPPPPPPAAVSPDFPPPPPPAAQIPMRLTLPQPGIADIGGVMLRGSAKVSAEGLDQISGDFSLVLQDEGGGMDIGTLRRFVTALWAVYFSKEGPGISIDPIAPGIDKHLVRYIGQVINSDLGRVMREADYLMKKWAVGSERPEIPDFENPDDIAARTRTLYVGPSSRFWFVPGDMRFKRAGDMLLFEDGRMTVQTEFVDRVRGRHADPANEAFAEAFTARYAEIAERHPIYRELFDYAKLVSLARHLKEGNVPLLWYLLANKDLVITEDSPGTVNELAKGSAYFADIEIRGGVDLAVAPSAASYVIDEEAAAALERAVALYGQPEAPGPSLLPRRTVVVDAPEDRVAITPARDLVVASSVVGEDRYHTDLAFRRGGEPGLELIRYHDPDYRGGVVSFGNDWHLMLPYRVAPASEARIPFLNAFIPDAMVVTNLITGREETLGFSDERYDIAGYVPDDVEISGIVGLFLLSDGSLRLVDKLGAEFQFDPEGFLTDMILAQGYHVGVEYADAALDAFERPPLGLRPVGEEMIPFLNVYVPKRMKVVDLVHGGSETLVFDDSRAIAGYAPLTDWTAGRFRFLAFMSDGSFRLVDDRENEILFDVAGRFKGIIGPSGTRFVRTLRHGHDRLEFSYELPRTGSVRIKKARLAGKRAQIVSYDYGLKKGRIDVAHSSEPGG